MSDQLISQLEAARILGMSPLTVRRLLNAGLLACVEVKGVGGGVRRRTHDTVRKVRLADIQAFDERFPARNGRRVYRKRKPTTPVDDDGEFIGAKRAAKLCGVGREAVIRWIRLGVLAAEKQPRPGKTREFYRIRRADLPTLIEAREARKAAFDAVEFVPQQEAAKLCGVSQAELCRWIRQGRLPATKIQSTMGRPMNRLARKDLDAFIASGKPRLPGLTSTEVAIRLGLTIRTIYKLVDSGYLPAVRRGNRRIISEKDLETFRAELMPQWLAEREKQKAARAPKKRKKGLRPRGRPRNGSGTA